MDWYYPVLGGVLRGHAAEARLASRWDKFIAPGRGVRCVADQPWITAAETCELVMALDAIGLHDRAHDLFCWVQFLRHDDGSYWTGMNFDGGCYDRQGEYYTAEQPTWNSAAVVLAANALGGSGPHAGLFRGEGLPAGLTADELVEAGAEIDAERNPSPKKLGQRDPAHHTARPRNDRTQPPWPPAAARVVLTRYGLARRRTRSEPVLVSGVKPSATARLYTSNGA
jgi:hypothetical protein